MGAIARITNSMNVIDKIYIREHAMYFLEYNQYSQLILTDRMVLAPYYNQLLAEQAKIELFGPENGHLH